MVCRDVMGEQVHERPIPEVHATILGLYDPEGSTAADHATSRPGGLSHAYGYLEYVRSFLSRNSLAVRIGGYAPDEDYGFLSRGRSLRDRSFLVNGLQVVTIGWPWRGRVASAVLDELRRAGHQYGLRHKYHRTAEDFDPDAYLVLADLDTEHGADSAILDELERRGRQLLNSSSVTVPLRPEDLRIVAYTDDHLPREGSKVSTLISVTTGS
jgi:hypothetical protein